MILLKIGLYRSFKSFSRRVFRNHKASTQVFMHLLTWLNRFQKYYCFSRGFFIIIIILMRQFLLLQKILFLGVAHIATSSLQIKIPLQTISTHHALSQVFNIFVQRHFQNHVFKIYYYFSYFSN